jgi:hypothetical protein
MRDALQNDLVDKTESFLRRIHQGVEETSNFMK